MSERFEPLFTEYLRTKEFSINKILRTSPRNLLGTSELELGKTRQDLLHPEEDDEANLLLNTLMYLELDLIDLTYKGKRELICIPTPLDSRRLLGLHYLASPYKFFGYDKGDINDWRKLYGHDPENKERKAKHEKFPGWKHFEADRDIIYEILVGEPYIPGDKQKQNYFAIPIMRFSVKESSIEWNFEPLEENLVDALVRISAVDKDYLDRLFTSLGGVYAAAFSDGVVQKLWHHRDGYVIKDSHDTNSIGVTQIQAYSVWKCEDLLKGRLVQAVGREMGVKVGVEQFVPPTVLDTFEEAVKYLLAPAKEPEKSEAENGTPITLYQFLTQNEEMLEIKPLDSQEIKSNKKKLVDPAGVSKFISILKGKPFEANK